MVSGYCAVTYWARSLDSWIHGRCGCNLELVIFKLPFSTSHCLSQWWARPPMLYGINSPQWDKLHIIALQVYLLVNIKIHHVTIQLTVMTYEISRPHELDSMFSNCLEIWQVSWHQCWARLNQETIASAVCLARQIFYFHDSPSIHKPAQHLV